MVEHLSAMPPALRVSLMLGHPGDVRPRHGVAEQVLAFLQKPFAPSTRAARIRDLLDQPKRATDAPHRVSGAASDTR